MATARFIAVIDIGKTNAKVVVFDLVAQQEVERMSTANIVVQSGRYPHFDTDGLWNFIILSLKALAAKHTIDAISTTTHGASAALLNAKGALALPVLDYEHDGPQSLAAEYDALRPAFDETGSPRLPNGLNLGTQIYWQAKMFPQQFANVQWIVTYPQYWSYRLCGVLTNEATSLGCHTDLWDYAKRDYSSLVDHMGWRKLMPPLRMASDCLGALLPGIAQATGLGLQTNVYCGIHDSNASILPHLLARRAPFSVVSTGTWVICMAIDSRRVTLDPSRDTLVNVSAVGEAVPIPKLPATVWFPVKALSPLRSAILAERRASGIVPPVSCEALSAVRFAPLPLKPPEKLLLALFMDTAFPYVPPKLNGGSVPINPDAFAPSAKIA